MAETVPIPKEGDPEAVPANNRPISLLPILSKVIERFAQKQFSDFLTRNDKLSIHQSSYKWHNSTETALVYVNDQLLKAVEEKAVLLLVLLDMSKAFDSLDHNYLLTKLRRLDLMQAAAASWFSSIIQKADPQKYFL